MAPLNDDQARYWCRPALHGTTHQHWVQWAPAETIRVTGRGPVRIDPDRTTTRRETPTMRTKIAAVVAGLMLALCAAIALPAAPADAAPTAPDATEAVSAPAAPERVIHNGQPEALWYCAAHRPNGYYVVHAWPYALWNGGVGYWCIAGFYGRDYQYWVHVQPPGSANSWLPWPFQLCYDAPGWVSYCQGPNGTHGPR